MITYSYFSLVCLLTDIAQFTLHIAQPHSIHLARNYSTCTKPNVRQLNTKIDCSFDVQFALRPTVSHGYFI